MNDIASVYSEESLVAAETRSPKTRTVIGYPSNASATDVAAILAHQSEVKDETRQVIEFNMNLIERMSEVDKGLRDDMLRNLQTVESLDAKVNAAQDKIKDSLELYTRQQEALRKIEGVVISLKSEHAQEFKKVKALSKRLASIKSKRIAVEEEISTASTVCDSRTKDLNVLLDKRIALETLSVRIEDTDPTESGQVQVVDAAAQTSIDAVVFEDIEAIRMQIKLQGKSLRDIRKSIDLIKRCS